ncbi:MAG: hypothetical protein AAF213_11520, partial [Pseudomonadota bacterium]
MTKLVDRIRRVFTRTRSTSPPQKSPTDKGGKRLKRLPFLFWCSVVYLIVELGFSAQLLVMAGSQITPEQLDSIELVGRTLSGIAITLFLIAGVTKAALPWRVKTAGIALITLVTIATVWTVQEVVIMGLLKTMSEDQRSRALVLTSSTGLIRDGHINIPTMDLSPEALAQPSGLSFMAMFPALALSRETIDDELKPLLPNAFKRALVLSCDGPVACLGSADQFVTEIWPPLEADLTAMYEQYDQVRRPAINPSREMVRDEAQSAWRRYQDRLQRRGLDHTTKHHRQVRQELRRQGLKVSDNWRLDDYQGFERAVRQRIIEKAGRAVRNALFDEFGTYEFPIDLNED